MKSDKNFSVAELPPMHSEAFLEINARERQILAGFPTKNQIEGLFQTAAFRYFAARIKQMANQSTNEFFSGVEVPNGIRAASSREAYFIGLVNADRAVLNLQRELWEEAIRREGADEEPPPPKRVEPEERFGGEL